MHQSSFSELEYAAKKKQTRRDQTGDNIFHGTDLIAKIHRAEERVEGASNFVHDSACTSRA